MSTIPFFNVLIFSLLAGGATILGIFLTLAREDFARKNSLYFISFAAGVLLSTAFLGLIPKSQELTSAALLTVLVSFLIFYLIEQVFLLHSCKENEVCETHSLGLISILGIGFHSLIDGVIIAAGFGLSFSLGLLATLSVLFHEIPEGISSVSILLHSGYSRQKTVIFSLGVALATPIGAILTYFFLQGISQEVLGLLLAFAAGSFLYLSASDLIPEIHKKLKPATIFLVLLGVLVPFLVEKLLS